MSITTNWKKNEVGFDLPSLIHSLLKKYRAIYELNNITIGTTQKTKMREEEDGAEKGANFDGEKNRTEHDRNEKVRIITTTRQAYRVTHLKRPCLVTS